MSPLLVLIVAVLATTYAGPIVRFAAAPAVAIAFWRLTLVLPVTFALAARERQRIGVVRAAFPLMLLSGVLLALHFWTWIASLRFTTVASSVLLVSLKPIFAWGIAALWLGEHPTRTERWGIALAVAGAALIGLADARASGGALGGDALALAGAVTGAGYYVIGRRVRRTVSVWSYASTVYAVAGVLLGFMAALSGAPLTGFASRDWAVFAALAASDLREEVAHHRHLPRLARVRGAAQRQLGGGDSEALDRAVGHERDRLKRLRGRAPERNEVGIAYPGYELPRRVDDGDVHYMQRLNHAAANLFNSHRHLPSPPHWRREKGDVPSGAPWAPRAPNRTSPFSLLPENVRFPRAPTAPPTVRPAGEPHVWPAPATQ